MFFGAHALLLRGREILRKYERAIVSHRNLNIHGEGGLSGRASRPSTGVYIHEKSEKLRWTLRNFNTATLASAREMGKRREGLRKSEVNLRISRQLCSVNPYYKLRKSIVLNIVRFGLCSLSFSLFPSFSLSLF